MSASGSGIPSAGNLLKRARGRGLTDIAVQGFGSWILAVITAGVAGLQSILQLLLVPINLIVDLANASVAAFFLEPFGIVSEGATTTAEAVSEFGIFGLFVAVAVVLATIYGIGQFLEREDTTDVPIPGLLLDPPIPGIGVDEEEQED
jgi:hypothetical protein